MHDHPKPSSVLSAGNLIIDPLIDRLHQIGAPVGIRSAEVTLGTGDPAMLVVAVGESACRRVRGAIASLDAATVDFPKLPHVSFYATPDKAGRPRYRVTFRVPGYPRRTDRLGRDGRKAYKWAQYVSETIDRVKCRTMKAEEAYRLLYVDRSPVDTHVDAYDRALKTKGVSEQYRKTTVYRIRECLDLAGVTRVDELTSRIVEPLLEKLREREAGEGKPRKIVERTINGYLDDLKKFTRWLDRTGRIAIDPLRKAQGVKQAGEEGRRRDASPEDIKEIYAAAMADTKPKGSGKRRMPAADRAMMYLVAYCTGLRRKELRAAEVSWLKLDAKEPHVALPDRYAKNMQRATQPIPTWLADMLKAWLGDRATGKLFPKMPRDIIKLFSADRDAARKAWVEAKDLDDAERKRRRESEFLKYKTPDGVLVFHSLRHGYASALLDSDADLKLAQFLTRHSTITLLVDRYGHARRSKAAAAVEKAIPNPVADVKAGGAR